MTMVGGMISKPETMWGLAHLALANTWAVKRRRPKSREVDPNSVPASVIGRVLEMTLACPGDRYVSRYQPRHDQFSPGFRRLVRRRLTFPR